MKVLLITVLCLAILGCKDYSKLENYGIEEVEKNCIPTNYYYYSRGVGYTPVYDCTSLK